MNVPFYQKLEPIERNDDKIRLIHHGLALPARKLEHMIELMHYLDERFELDFMLLNMEREYGKKLIEYAQNEKGIKFLPTVGSNEVPSRINEYDMGVFLLEPNTFNHRMALPNKLFQFIQARLGVAIWPSPEMVKIVDKYKVGVYSQYFDVKEMADTLNALTKEEIMKFKWNSHEAAKELNSEKNRKQLLDIVHQLIG